MTSLSQSRRRLSVVASIAALATVAAITASVAEPATTRAPQHVTASKFHKIKYVWNILLENENYGSSFGDPASDPYLAKTLRAKGLLLEDYYGVGHNSNDNYIALVSGQEPNTDTDDDCGTFVNFPKPDQGQYTPGEPKQQLGMGCVYPKNIGDIGNQLSTKHISWKGYMEDMGNIPSRESAACGHPTVGKSDNTESAAIGDGYATRHDPFPYFHQVIDNKKFCDAHIVAQGTAAGKMPKTALKGETGLAHDLKNIKFTPHYSFLTPNLCDDGHDSPCKDGQTSISKNGDIDRWLQTWVPKILKSKAYKTGGLIEITFDESDGFEFDSSACCGEGTDPNVGRTGLAGQTGLGGGKVGALLLSPFINPGTSSTSPYNHYSTLATDEAVFGLPKLGWATKANVFSSSYFTR